MTGSTFQRSAWVKNEAARLRNRSEDTSLVGSGGFLMSSGGVETEAAAAIEFLRRLAPESSFHHAALGAVNKTTFAKDYLLRIADLLELFNESLEVGLLTTIPYEVRSRVDAATDLMEQVQILLDDRDIHPAAPVVLAGAALEATLRALWEEALKPTLNSKPGINAYAAALQAHGSLDRQEVKELTAWAGVRNDAAHGNVASVDIRRARLMVDGINLFIQRRSPLTT